MFKKEESNVNKLELNDVKVELEEALKTANKVRSEKYKVDYVNNMLRKNNKLSKIGRAHV